VSRVPGAKDQAPRGTAGNGGERRGTAGNGGERQVISPSRRRLRSSACTLPLQVRTDSASCDHATRRSQGGGRRGIPRRGRPRCVATGSSSRSRSGSGAFTMRRSISRTTTRTGPGCSAARPTACEPYWVRRRCAWSMSGRRRYRAWRPSPSSTSCWHLNPGRRRRGPYAAARHRHDLGARRPRRRHLSAPSSPPGVADRTPPVNQRQERVGGARVDTPP
jgi:hypothetical protein